MSDVFGDRRVVTPEAVVLDVDIAGLGSRMIAAMIDGVFQGLFLLGFSAIAGAAGLSGSGGAVVIIVAYFLVLWAYFPVFETLWNGRTPGKRLQRLRVVRTDGQPVTVSISLVRNLIRIVDFLPFTYGVGAITMLISKRSQRLGDLAAGTLVVRDRKATDVPRVATFDHADAAEVEVSALSHHDYVVVREFLQRRDTLEASSRAQLARTIADALRPRVGGAHPDGDEGFLESVAASFRRRQAPGPTP